MNTKPYINHALNLHANLRDGIEFDALDASRRALYQVEELHAQNVELLAALTRLVRDCDGDTLGTVKAPRYAIACEASAAIARAKAKA